MSDEEKIASSASFGEDQKSSSEAFLASENSYSAKESYSLVAFSNENEHLDFSYHDQFIISEADKKLYRHIVLDNGLQVLLIHEPEGLKGAAVSNSSAHRGGNDKSDSDSDSDSDNDADDHFSDSYDSGSDSAGSDADVGKHQRQRRRGGGASVSECSEPSSARRSAAALCIGSGSADEGSELPGLAHWLEHMVFMGSAKYPTENDFDAYVSERGGDSNAWTDMECTVFQFDCRQESFIDCLDRFANFFVSPLLSADSLEREVQAVHSEFELSCCSLQSQLEFFTGCLTSPGHPLSGFKWGNRASLWELPRAAGIDVRARLQAFRDAHYRAGNMTAALQSRLSLDAMETAARVSFGGLPPGPRIKNPEGPLATAQPAFGDRFRGRIYCLLPVKQVDRLQLSWPCPPTKDRHLEQTHRLIGFCLAHEGPGSLADCLRRHGLAVELVAGVHTGCGLSDNSWSSLMELSLKLTPKGLLDWRRVVRLIYAYIGMMGENLDQIRRVFDELQLVERADFRFVEETEPADSVETLCVSMRRLPTSLWLLGDHRLPHRYDAVAVRDFWRCLRPENGCLLLASKSFKAACDKVTDWFEIWYSEMSPDPACQSDWQRCVDQPDASFLAEMQLFLPPPNPFIATNFNVPTPEEAYSDMQLTELPQFPIRLMLDQPELDKFGALYFFKDRQFNTPRAVVRVSMESPAIAETLKSSTTAQVWLYMLNFQLQRDAYAANEAGLRYDIVQSEPRAIIFDLEGFNDKLFVLYLTILDKLQQFGQMLEAEDTASLNFDSAKEEVRKLLANDLLSAKRFASNIRHFLTEPHRYLASDQLQCLEPLTIADVAEFHRKLLSIVFFKVYVHGNYTPKDAKAYFKRTMALLSWNAEVANLKNEFEAMPPGRHGVRLRGMRRGDVNSLLVEEVQFPHPPSLRDMAFADLLLHIMSEPCFDFLRTKHQLGYQVYCQAHRRRGCLSYRLLVASQADQFSMDDILATVDKFALHFLGLLRRMPRDQFDNYVKAVVDRKLAEDSVMADEADRYWEEIDEDALLFDRRQREVQILQSLTPNELEPFYKQVMSTSRRSFVYQIEGSKKKMLHEGGTVGYSLPLEYAKLPKPSSRMKKQPKSNADSAYAPPVNYTKDIRVFKGGMLKLTAAPVLE